MPMNAPMAHAVIKLAGIAGLSDTSSTPEVGLADGSAMKLQHQVSVSAADETTSKKNTNDAGSPFPPLSEAHTTAASEEPGNALRLCLRCTFIDTCENEEDEIVHSPRAASDPGSEISSGYSSLRASVAGVILKERAYVAGLSQQVSRTLSSKAKSKLNTSPGNSAVNGRFASVSASSEDGSVNRSLSFTHDPAPKVRTRPKSPLARSLASASTVASVATQRDFPSGKRLRSSNSSDMSVLEMRPLDVKPKRPDELRTLVHKNNAEINKVLNCQRLSSALTSIKEIPDQVEEVFHQSASFLLDEVLDEVSNARDLLVNSHANHGKLDEPSSNAERAAQSITMIPDMIMASFEAKFAAAMSTVRIRVDDVIQEIQGIEGIHLAKEQVVQNMLALPAMVREITRDAVKAASQESRENVLSQLERVLQSMADETMPDALVQAKRQIVARVPKKLPDTERAATEAAESNVCQAVKVVQENCQAVRADNRVLADSLLRAKAGPSLLGADADQSGLESLRVVNPGSVGHPELCSRACLYFSMGKCSNGVDCSFCHAPHSQRATHLDKRHRDWIRAMDFSRLFHTIRPTLRAKFVALGVGQEVWENLAALDAMTDSKSEAPPPDRKRTKELRTLQMALKYLSVRSLLTLLQNAPTIEGSPEHAAIVSLLINTRPEPSPHE